MLYMACCRLHFADKPLQVVLSFSKNAVYKHPLHVYVLFAIVVENACIATINAIKSRSIHAGAQILNREKQVRVAS